MPKHMLAFVGLSSWLFATIIYVPGDVSRIYTGLALSLPGDTVLVANGMYSPSTNAEVFPLTLRDSVCLIGESAEGVILDAEGQNPLFELVDVDGAHLSSFTIQGGQAYNGAGLHIVNATPVLSTLIIMNNHAHDYGGGIAIEDSDPQLIDVEVRNNSSGERGGGIYCGSNSNPMFLDVSITGNLSTHEGGGLFLYDSEPLLRNVTITGNSANDLGGGICMANSIPVFHAEDRCNIYLNLAAIGSDISKTLEDVSPTTAVFVDTFTVLQPTAYHAFPLDDFTFDIQSAMLEQVDADLYVSPDGDNGNSGLSPDDALRNISMAYQMIQADSQNPRSIFLADGLYSPGTNEEVFPITLLDHVSLVGESEMGVILDAAHTAGVLSIVAAQGVVVSHLTITGGDQQGDGGGVFCSMSDPVFQYVTITDNESRGGHGGNGGGVYCEFSNAVFSHVTITDNHSFGRDAATGGGIRLTNSNPLFSHVVITNNNSKSGGGLYLENSNPTLSYVTIADNYAHSTGFIPTGGGGIWCDSSNPLIVNSILIGNTADNTNVGGGGFLCINNSHPQLVNSIVWGNTPEHAAFLPWYENHSSILFAHSAVEYGSFFIVVSEYDSLYWLDGNIDSDPMFVDPDSGNYELQHSSPCIDAGTAFLTWAGDTLIHLQPHEYIGIAPDMGIHEAVMMGDLNFDNILDINDLLRMMDIIILLVEPGSPDEMLVADMNADTLVNVQDVILLLEWILLR